MTMFLKQHGDKILFGTDEHTHHLSTKLRTHFKAEDVEAAQAALHEAYPDADEDIDRYAERLLRMLD